MASVSWDILSCTPREPKDEWFVVLLVVSISFFVLFLVYLSRLALFHCQTWGYPLSFLGARILFSSALVIKGVCLAVQAFGYKYQIDFSVFKFVITSFPFYFNCVAYFAIFITWMKTYSSHVKRAFQSLFKVLEWVGQIYYVCCLFMFFILFLVRCVIGDDESLERWNYVSPWLSIAPESVLSLLVLGCMIALRIKLKMSFACNLGDPSQYLMIISIILLVSTFVNIGGRLLLLVFNRHYDECDEIVLIFRMIYEGFGVLLPFGFLSVIDILTPPRVDEMSTEVNWGIGSGISE
jgi:hypothetical protein